MTGSKTIKKTALLPTVLITHAGGFVTYYLAQFLLSKNCRVVVLSNFKEYPDEKLKSLVKNPKFALFDCNVNLSLPAQIESVDYIFHLAVYDSFLYAQDGADLDFLLSAGVGTKLLLDLAVKSKAKFGLILPHISTSTHQQEFNRGAKEAITYAKALVNEYKNKYELDARLVYLGRVYGVGMGFKEAGDLGFLVKNILDGTNLKVYNDGARKDFYTFYADAVAGLVKSLFSQKYGSEFTLFEERPHSSLEVAFILKAISNGYTDIENEESDVNYSLPNVEGFSYPPSWKPKVELKEGLIKTLKGFGYKVNVKSFKAASLIDEKIKSIQENYVNFLANEPLEKVNQIVNKVQEPKISPIKIFACRIERKLRENVSRIRNFADQSKLKTKAKIALGVLGGSITLAGTVFVVPVIQSYKYAKNAFNYLQDFEFSVLKLDPQGAKKFSEEAYNNFSKLENSLKRLEFPARILGKSEELSSFIFLAQSAKNFSFGIYNISLGVEPISQVWTALKPGGRVNFSQKDFLQASLYFKESRKGLDLALASLNLVNEQKLPKNLKKDFNKYKKTLDLFVESSDFFASLALELPNILGLDGQKRYLILFQNNNEIRPTGGFLGSYADVIVENGKIISINIDDIYNPDGKLKESNANVIFKTPQVLKGALDEEYLYIRNANWHPSFVESAKTINELFNLVDGRSYYGIFAVDLYFVRDLLSIIGPVYLTSFDEEIRADNMYERVQFHSDFNFKEGESSKRGFLTALGGKVLEKVFSLPSEKMPEFLNLLYLSLEQKHLLVNLDGTYLSRYLSQKGWNGGLLDAEGDFLYVVNSNIGGTKSNYYVKNQMTYAVSSKTRDGVLRAELELSYEHTQKDNSWPGGPYVNYVRVLTQEGTKLTGAFVLGGRHEKQVLAKNKENLSSNESPVLGASEGVSVYEEVAISKVGKYTSYEYKITIYPQEKVKFILTYDLPQNLTAQKDLVNKYRLTWQKQPGTQNDNFKFMFSGPFGTKIINASPTGSVSDNVYELLGFMDSDLRISLDYK